MYAVLDCHERRGTVPLENEGSASSTREPEVRGAVRGAQWVSLVVPSYVGMPRTNEP